MRIDLTGQVAIVTGGARDIGAAIVTRLAEAGASVAVNYHASGDAAKTLVAQLTAAKHKAVAIQADVSQPADAERLVTETRKAFGARIHILVNNAGGMVARKKMEDMDAAFWDEVMALNLRSLFLATKAALPHMADGGAIVNLSSLAARDGGGGGAIAYSTAKGGVMTFTRGLAKELASRKIRVNCVAPGLIGTTFHDTFTKPDVRQAVAGRTLAGREGAADEVAQAVLFLASSASSYINGEAIDINGGLYFA
jgi:3-oxoacyl-[acyl-carrier protein] reductase